MPGRHAQQAHGQEGEESVESKRALNAAIAALSALLFVLDSYCADYCPFIIFRLTVPADCLLTI